MSETKHTKLLIIGSGPAGYTAAVYAARAMLGPVLVRGLQPGGQLTITTDVENYPGFADAIQGPWLMEQMEAQAAHVGTEIISDIITKADLNTRPFTMTGDSGRFTPPTVIIATGAQASGLGLEIELHFQGFVVSACSTCDGFFYRNKEVLVVGGGNTAVEEALFLTNFASKVTLVHRRDSLRSEKILQQRLLAHDKIDVVWNSEIDEVLGTDDPLGVTGARLRNTQTGDTHEVAADGIFIAIGHAPSTELFTEQLQTKSGGYLITAPDSTETSIEGVYAAGDVTDDIYRQAVTAAGMGCGSLEAEKYLASLEAEKKPPSKPFSQLLKSTPRHFARRFAACLFFRAQYLGRCAVVCIPFCAINVTSCSVQSVKRSATRCTTAPLRCTRPSI